MEPALSWVVSGLSAFLLGAGGYLLARALLLPKLERHRVLAEQQKAKLTELVQANQALHEELARQVSAAPRRPAPERRGSQPDTDGFEESTVLPDPVGYFERLPDRPSAPRLKRVSEDEYEIPAAAPPSAGEGANGDGEGRDATRQFKLHSPEAVVHFLQRIDELTDENRELKAALKEKERLIRDQKVEGSEHVQRFAALDATADKLRQELKRKAQRIRQLEERLEGEIRNAPSPQASSSAAPPPPPPASVLSKVIESQRSGSGAASAPDAPTLEVHRFDESELRGGPAGKK